MKNEIKNTLFIKSIVNLTDKPALRRPEFAFVGRSNVGKSSLINCLVNRKNIARVSKNPGKTDTINFFEIDESFYLVDLPGYGFARRSRDTKKDWQRMIEAYLLGSKDLRTVFVLVDSKVGAKESDGQLVEWLRFHKLPFKIIATKSDKISRSRQRQCAQEILRSLKLPEENPLIFFSAKNKQGRELLIDLLFAESVRTVAQSGQ